eukprot:g15830.t1
MAGGTAAAVGFPIIAPMNGGSVDDHQRRQSNGSASSTASSRRPVVQGFPRRGSRVGAGVPSSEEPPRAAPPSYFDMTRAA